LYVNTSFGRAMSYNYWFNWAITLAVEISAATIIMKYWFPDVSPAIISGLFFSLILTINLFSVRVFGEMEYLLSFIKVAVIITFIVLCCFLIGKHTTMSIHHLFIAGGPFHHGWLGFFSVFLVAGFAFQGAELMGISAGETKDPQKNIPKAVKTIFWRLILFYIITTLFISLLIPFNDPALAHQNSVDSSPFTLIFQNYFGHGLAANIINFVVLIAIVSAANASMYAATRTLWHMGSAGQAPKVFSKITSYGLPIYALAGTALIGSCVFLSSLVGSGVLFTALLTISALCGFIAWFGIALTHLFFRRRYLKNNPTPLLYKAKLFPYAPILAIAFIGIIIIGQGYGLIEHFAWSSLLKQYGALIVFITIMMACVIKNNDKKNN
ncbi:MAG: amino acid permease, partial [Gammaproteobacteria bacterium]|nr:amino acid permease [Gammaproteobacteria bacterium]